MFEDERIPIDAYQSTFVKSLVMVPIRQASPLGAIGNYWATYHVALVQEVKLLQSLADATSVAITNIWVHAELKQRVQAHQATEATLQQQVERQRLMMEMAQRIRQSLNLTEILQTTVEEVRQVSPDRSCPHISI